MWGNFCHVIGEIYLVECGYLEFGIIIKHSIANPRYWHKYIEKKPVKNYFAQEALSLNSMSGCVKHITSPVCTKNITQVLKKFKKNIIHFLRNRMN